jgi:hypothetical protein
MGIHLSKSGGRVNFIAIFSVWLFELFGGAAVAFDFLSTPIFQQLMWLVRWSDMDVWTRRRLYREVTLSRSDF